LPHCTRTLTPAPLLLYTIPPPPRPPLFPYTTLFRSPIRSGPCGADCGWPSPGDTTRTIAPTSSNCCTSSRSPATARMYSNCLRRSEEHTSELQSLTNLVCRLLLGKKNTHTPSTSSPH